MDYGIIIMVGIIVILVLVLLFILWKTRKLKKQKLELPQEVLNDFNTFENKMRMSQGTADPYTMMWEHSKNRVERRNNNGVYIQEDAAGNSEGRRYSNLTASGREQQVEGNFSQLRNGNVDFKSKNFQPIPPKPTSEYDDRDRETEKRTKPNRRKFEPI